MRGAVSCSVRGYVSEDDVSRIETATTGLFVPEDLTEPTRRVQIERIAGSGTGAMDLIELSSHYGGGVAARSLSRPGDNRVQVPVAGQFLVFGTFSSDGGDCNRGHASRGTLHLTGRAETLAARSWRNVLKVLVRESGF